MLAGPRLSNHRRGLSPAQNIQSLIDELNRLASPQDRLAWLVARSKRTPPWPPESRLDELKLSGCLANLWFLPSLENGKCHFRADSDSAVVRGIALLLCDIYSGATPETIVASPPDALQQAGFHQILTPNRRNAIPRVWERILNFSRQAMTSGQTSSGS